MMAKLRTYLPLLPTGQSKSYPPEQNQTKVVRNILHCLSHGTQMGWLIDPEEELIFVYGTDRTISVFEQKEDLLPVPEFAASFELTIDRLFSWLQD
jgi:Uma2 family endonuclease